MLELREKWSDPLSMEEILVLAKKLEITLPYDYVKFLNKSSTGLLEFNFAKVQIGNSADEIGIESLDAAEQVIFYWNNLKDYEDFKSEFLVPIGGILGAKTLCMGYSEFNLNQLFILHTNLYPEKINETLDELINKIEYCYSPEKNKKQTIE